LEVQEKKKKEGSTKKSQKEGSLIGDLKRALWSWG